MKFAAWLFLGAALAGLGCQRSEKPLGSTSQSAQEPSPPKVSGSAGQSGQSSVAPMAGVGAGPMTPVSGSENLQGGGGGSGQVMQEKARGLAGQSPSSINQMGGEGP